MYNIWEIIKIEGKKQQVMDWNTRMRIEIGYEKGLEYLNEDCKSYTL